jgi:hypothetical protein
MNAIKSQNKMKQLMAAGSMLLFLFLLSGTSYSQQHSLQGLPNTSVFSFVSNNTAADLVKSTPMQIEEGTLISYTFPYVSTVNLVIYDKKGRELKVIVNETMAPGSYSHDITALNLRSGIYYYRLTIDDKTDVKKINIY